MDPLLTLLLLLVLSALSYRLGSQRAFALSTASMQKPHSLPFYHGAFTVLCCALPASTILLLWIGFEDHLITALTIAELPPAIRNLPDDRLGLVINDLHNLVSGNIISANIDPTLRTAARHYSDLQATSNGLLTGVVLIAAMGGFIYAWRSIAPQTRARNRVEAAFKGFLLISSTVAILTTIGIVLSVLFESIRFFHLVPMDEFLFGTNWSPQTAIRADQVGSSGSFGVIPLFVGTMLIALIAMLIATPIGLFSAIYLSEYASHRLRSIAKPMIEILAGIPTVVYGFFAALTVAPLVREAGHFIGLNVAAESALAAGLVMGIMIIPFVSSLSDDVIKAVPQTLRDGSYALGATQSETIRLVVIPAALHGIIGSLLLAVSRAIGETMIVVMAAGLAANLTVNPLQAVTTVTVQIVTLLIGDQEFDSAKTLAAFALGLTLFVVTLGLNLVALYITRRYREQYE